MRSRRNFSLFLPIVLCLAALSSAGLLAEEARAGAAARYVVFEIDADGAVRPQLLRVVELSSAWRSLTSEEVASRLARPARDVEQVHVRMFADGGALAFEDVVAVPRWMRSELPLSEDTEGADIEGGLPLSGKRAFVVRVPVVERSWLALSVGRDGRMPREAAFRDAEFDLDALAADASLPLARFAPEVELRSAAAANSGNRVDVLVMGDGYTSGEHAKFDTDAANLVSNFFSIAPYGTYRNFVNTATLFTASTQSGADHPPFNASCASTPFPSCCADPTAQTDTKSGTFVTTAFDATFCSSNIHRLMIVDAAKVLAAAAASPDWDHIVVIVNDTTYGGSGGSIATVSTNPSALSIAQHEYGHSFTELADEYQTPFPGFPACSDVTSPACEPNVTDQQDRASIKWTDWIAAATPVPTPATAQYNSAVGLFEGARFLSTGMFRSRQNCLMRALGQPFCEICKQEYVFQLYRGGWGVPAGGIDLIEPGSESPAPGFVSIPFPGSQTFSVGVLKPTGGSLAASWYIDGAPIQGASSNSYTFTPTAEGVQRIEVRVRDTTNLVKDEAGAGVSLTGTRTWTAGVGQAGRFQIEVDWAVPSQGRSGVGTEVALSADTRYFWFFTPANIELVIKVLDARSINQHYWVFYGALSSVQYTIRITDTATGAVKTYTNPAGTLASVADIEAFAGATGGAADAPLAQASDVAWALAAQAKAGFAPGAPSVASLPGGDLAPAPAACTTNSQTLCLNASRFQIRVDWAVPAQGRTGIGTAVGVTSDTGYFWFFTSANVELVIKVLDGRGINDHFWVFYGALSGVQYTIHITDTQTGATKTYSNPSGTLASVADTSAF
jgi:IgA Peptidase M64